MGNTSDLYRGGVMKYEGENCLIVDVEFRKPGKGGAFYKVKLKNLATGKQKEHTFNSGASVEMVRIERKPYQYLYFDGSNYIFMNVDTYEQIPVSDEMLGEQIKFMKENEQVQVSFEGDTPLSVEIPLHVNLRVESTEPGLKGDTATNATKPAKLETGAEVQVPLFIVENDLIRIDTQSGAYLERIKE